MALAHSPGLKQQEGVDSGLLEGWGPVLGVWEGYAADPEIRFAGSSGGVATGLALYCLEKQGMEGVLHTAANPTIPYLNETVISSSRAQLLARTGSRYSPASPAEGLAYIEDSDTPCVFIGKPCDAAAVQKARILRPELDKKVGLIIGFFCAGVPSTQGVVDLLKTNGIDDVASLRSLRFRGNGWPGMWTARFINKSGEEQSRQRTYAESWDFLQKYRQWRCYICPDHTGEFSDVAVGDPWYRDVQPGEPGKSLIVARTERGLEFICAAAAAGYIVLEARDATLLPRSQNNILTTRATLWARLMTLKVMGAAVPEFSGFSLFKLWLSKLSLRQKAQSILGTAKRVLSKGLRKKVYLREWRPASDKAPE
jgi:coenzyme F420 hydrogenase subunit beta